MDAGVQKKLTGQIRNWEEVDERLLKIDLKSINTTLFFELYTHLIMMLIIIGRMISKKN